MEIYILYGSCPSGSECRTHIAPTGVHRPNIEPAHRDGRGRGGARRWLPLRYTANCCYTAMTHASAIANRSSWWTSVPAGGSKDRVKRNLQKLKSSLSLPLRGKIISQTTMPPKIWSLDYHVRCTLCTQRCKCIIHSVRD